MSPATASVPPVCMDYRRRLHHWATVMVGVDIELHVENPTAPLRIAWRTSTGIAVIDRLYLCGRPEASRTRSALDVGRVGVPHPTGALSLVDHPVVSGKRRFCCR